MKIKAKNILLIAVPALIVIFNLVMYIQSYEYYADEWGTDISFDSDYLVYMLCGIALLVPAIIDATKGATKLEYSVSGMVIGSLLGFYPLGVFFKAVFKAMEKGKPFDFAGMQMYLYIGIIGLVLLAYMIMSYIEIKKERKSL